MTNDEFKAWRKHMKLPQREAADLLGISRNSVALYEIGERDGNPVVIPKSIELACAALALGIRRYSGPDIAPPADT